MTAKLLEVDGLSVSFATERGELYALDGVSFEVERGGAVALVGESGAGKSVTALSLLRLLPTPPARVVAGDVRLEGQSLLDLDERGMRAVRGGRIGLVFQEPMTSLNPVYSIGWQVAEAVKLHAKLGRREVRERALDTLRRVRFPDADAAFDVYPHVLSGGMRQRALIAIALAARPALLVADEPTTALDANLQAEITELLRTLREELGMALLLVAHDLALVAEVAEEVVVMYGGVVVERGRTADVLRAPAHPYTAALLRSVPPERAYRVRGQKARRLPTIGGEPLDLCAPPPGCRFEPRCPDAFARCGTERPPPYATAAGVARCFLADPDHKPAARLALVDEPTDRASRA